MQEKCLEKTGMLLASIHPDLPKSVLPSASNRNTFPYPISHKYPGPSFTPNIAVVPHPKEHLP